MSKGKNTPCPKESCKGKLVIVRLPVELDIDVLREIFGGSKFGVFKNLLTDDDSLFVFEQFLSEKENVETHPVQSRPKKEAQVHLHPAVAGVDILACNACGTAVIPAAIKIKPNTS